MLVAHHRHIIQPIHVRQRLNIGLVFSQFFGGAMQQPHMGIGMLHDFAIQFENESQHPMRRRVLGAKINRVIADFRHGDTLMGFSPASHNRVRARCVV